MSDHVHQAVEWDLGASAETTQALLSLPRQQLAHSSSVPPPRSEDTLAVKQERRPPVRFGDLPKDVQRLVERYEKSHRGVRVEPARLPSVGAPGDHATTFDPADIPSDEDFLVLALIETAASQAHVEVRSHVLIARRRLAGRIP